ncbi:DUF6314 family protein [Curtobacterium herbarum]|uniref:DUF6314 family protein n=1 Tax=Curtobacterium herbarum TaxID=150122 RepID=A0ABP4K8G9_9MICO|nr:DUF6314 family protein [Curtobacterium herbarum]MBM7476790.1 hypothetical protein [Curtobacterium herbarum]MCS6545196.1 DUF6314 family protein [Curtobacterium herbarum]
MTGALAPTDLLGQWVLERTVHDRLADLRGTVTGTTELNAVDDDTVRWHETGTMVLGDRTTPVWRTLAVRRGAAAVTGGGPARGGPDAPDGRWRVCFADGRPFHDWVWGARVEHACDPDDYTGLLAGTPERWTVRWHARGPAKDLLLASTLTPMR